jgi:hypothetical protein
VTVVQSYPYQVTSSDRVAQSYPYQVASSDRVAQSYPYQVASSDRVAQSYPYAFYALQLCGGGILTCLYTDSQWTNHAFCGSLLNSKFFVSTLRCVLVDSHCINQVASSNTCFHGQIL